MSCGCESIHNEPNNGRDIPCHLIEFKGHRRGFFLDPGRMEFKRGETIIVEADRGEDAGVYRATLPHPPYTCNSVDYKVVRIACDEDLRKLDRYREWEHEALKLCAKKAVSHHIQMKVVDAEYRFDGLKLTFYFTAEGRVDFRELVRDLASTFRTRIELRQIGARDEVRRCKSYGVCGRELCCSAFLDGFQPITTGMAKSQHLILNPSKLSGCCARLKCCLAFEADHYDHTGSSAALESPEDEALIAQLAEKN